MNAQTVRDWAEARGLRAAVLDVDALAAVQNRLETLRGAGAFNPRFFESYLSGFRYLRDSAVSDPRGLILVAAPRPAHVVVFRLPDRELEAVLPPTYVKYRPFSEELLDALRADIGLATSDVDLLSAPLKTLSAAAGLIRFGRNNIGYAPGWGSYFQLVGFVTRFPLAPETAPLGIEDRGLDACEGCDRCLRACPTGAITEARFLLRAETCLTLASETYDLGPRPLRPAPHNCLMGCLVCQEVCPVNKGLLKRERTGLVFPASETEALLHDREEKEESLWTEIRAKFGTLGLTEDTRLFARNMRLLLGLEA
ncbi:MAG: 4Fe-4S dicluster domain-containing protein [Candidatus Aminicenantes bacterium]|nr:4Fe-4S dicluster domain-containing protein [Candidatus Aminicenantes bacterium]